MRTAGQPLVSILLPAFNAAATLPACLRSVQRQTERRWECVVVDDGSWDDTGACARAFAEADERFTVVTTGHHGLVDALNAGLERCTGRFVARMDADDLMHRHRLTEQVRWLETHPELTAVGSHVRCFPRRQLRAGSRAYERWLNSIDSPQRLREEAYIECPIAHPSLMIHRTTLAQLGYRDCRWPEDYDLVLRLLHGGHGVGVVPQRLISWRESLQRLSRRDPTYALQRFTACKAAFLASHFLARTETYILWGYGGTGRALRRALRTHGKHVAHVVEVHPGRLGNTIHGAPVIPPDDLVRLPRRPVVVSVAGEEPRRQIRRALHDMGFEETIHFVCAA